MSAYVVDHDHIRYLVSAAMDARIIGHCSSAMRWRWGGETVRRAELHFGEIEKAAEVGQMLWDENLRSVRARYPNCAADDLPGPVDCDYVYGEHRPWFGRMDPVQVLKAIRCYAYQTCETGDYEATEAYAFLNSLEQHCIASLPGYGDAAWGAPEEQVRAETPDGKPVAGRAYSISDMMAGKPLKDCEVPK
jgi:hypothetical protein